jgi:hypothetical protein
MRLGRRLLFASIVAVVAACGSRTGLLVPPPEDSGAPDVADVFHRDVLTRDVFEEETEDEDALPPLDVTPPMDVVNICPDAASTLVYVITEDYHLYSFYPPSLAFTQIGSGPITCPATGGATPFSMAVNRNGVAFIVFNDGELFRVSTLTAACQPTGFVPMQQGFSATFGMGFSRDLMDTGETLYVASDETGNAPSRLATIDTMTFQLTVVGAFNPAINRAELTGTGAGDLFAFYSVNGMVDSAIGQIDKMTAQVVGQFTLSGVPQGNGWAFAFWGGDFYTFTAPSGNTVVTRYRPSDSSVVQVASMQSIIVGAGVSTCAPQQ